MLPLPTMGHIDIRKWLLYFSNSVLEHESDREQVPLCDIPPSIPDGELKKTKPTPDRLGLTMYQ